MSFYIKTPESNSDSDFSRKYIHLLITYSSKDSNSYPAPFQV